MSYWGKFWLVGWAAILGLGTGYELWGYWKRLSGDKSYPPLSNIIALIPKHVRHVLIVVLAGILWWHFDVVEKEQLKRKMNAAQLYR